MHLDVQLPSKHHPPETPKEPAEPDAVPTAIPAIVPTAIPLETLTAKKRLLIRVEVEAGRVVSESSHYTD